jgi:hypothetical protein
VAALFAPRHRTGRRARFESAASGGRRSAVTGASGSGQHVAAHAARASRMMGVRRAAGSEEAQDQGRSEAEWPNAVFFAHCHFHVSLACGARVTQPSSVMPIVAGLTRRSNRGFTPDPMP